MGCQVYYFSGAYSQNLKRELNVDQLFSMYHEPKLVIETIEYKRAHPEYTANIMLDSGAFSHFQNMKKKGETLTDKDLYDYTDKYIEYLNEWGEDLTCFVGVDSVPDPTNVDHTLIQKTWDNYIYMWERLKPSIRHKLIPVFHYGEDFDWLKKFLNHVHPDGSMIDYMGLAISLEGTRKVRINWGQKCMKIIRESNNPNIKTHAFGVGVKSVLEHIDVYSTDATSWVKRAAYGMISIDDKAVTVSDVQKEQLSGKHYTERATGYQVAVEEEAMKRGFRIDPEEGTYILTETGFDATVGKYLVKGAVNGTSMDVTFTSETEGWTDTYKLDSVTAYDDGLERDGLCGAWEATKDEKALVFDGLGKFKYDNGRCLSTNPYARARFNIMDTVEWMKDLKKHRVEVVMEKKNLGW